MTDPIAVPQRPGQAIYADQINQTAWREKMLTQVLDAVKTVSTGPDKGRGNLSPHWEKGNIVDIYI